MGRDTTHRHQPGWPCHNPLCPDAGRQTTCLGCGNDLAGDNLCMVSACQWEGTEGREATPEDVAYAAVVAVRDAYPRLPDDADSWEVAEFVVAKLRAAGHIAEVPDA